jgi:hypothetical protein
MDAGRVKDMLCNQKAIRYNNATNGENIIGPSIDWASKF